MKLIRFVLQLIGATTVLFLAALVVYAIFSSYGSTKTLDKDDAVFVLNWGGIGTSQTWTVIDGSVSPRNITGDHADYYCIQLENIATDKTVGLGWQAGPERNELFADALERAVGWAKSAGADCFPTFDLANSERMMIMFHGAIIHGREPAGAQVLLLHPTTKRLFYVSFDT